MTVLSIILGIFMVIGGFCCMFTPLTTFISAEYLVVILLLAVGIIGLIKGIAAKRYEVSFFFSILSVIFALAVVFFPQLFVLTSGVLIYLLAFWIVLEGVVTIYSSIVFGKATGSGMWILQLIIGILVVILGCYVFVHPTLFAATIASTLGFLIGLFFVVIGFAYIFAPLAESE